MSPSPTLALIRGDDVVHRVPVPPTGLRVGRGPDNDLALADGEVSRHHLLLWWAEGCLWARDLGSRNGTMLGAVALDGARPVGDGDELLLGGAALLRVEGVPSPESTEPRWLWVAEDTTAGLRHHLPDADGPSRAWTPPGAGDRRLWARGGAAFLRRAGEEARALEPGTTLTLGGTTYVIRRLQPVREVTVGPSGEGWPYQVRATLAGAGGPTATVRPLGPEGAVTTITADTRATLVWILVRQLAEDRAGGRPPDEQGWVDDEDAVVGVWGRRGQEMDVNSLHVLVYRLRRDLKAAGLDGACLEKRRGALRLFVQQAALVEDGP